MDHPTLLRTTGTAMPKLSHHAGQPGQPAGSDPGTGGIGLGIRHEKLALIAHPTPSASMALGSTRLPVWQVTVPTPLDALEALPTSPCSLQVPMLEPQTPVHDATSGPSHNTQPSQRRSPTGNPADANLQPCSSATSSLPLTEMRPSTPGLRSTDSDFPQLSPRVSIRTSTEASPAEPSTPSPLSIPILKPSNLDGKSPVLLKGQRDPSTVVTDWEQAKLIQLTCISGEKKSLYDVVNRRRVAVVSLRRFNCPTCFAYVILFSHLRSVINAGNTDIIFLSPTSYLSDVFLFMRNFAFWLRHAENVAGNVQGEYPVPGEFYLDADRTASKFLGFDRTIFKMRSISLLARGLLDKSFRSSKGDRAGSDPATRPALSVPRSQKQAWHQLTAFVLRRMLHSLEGRGIYYDAPGICLIDNRRVIYHFVSQDQYEPLPSTPNNFLSDIGCPAPNVFPKTWLQDCIHDFLKIVNTPDRNRIYTQNLPVLSRLGSGRESIVHQSKWMGRYVAVKRYRRLAADNVDVISFSNEVTCLMSLHHKNIIGFLGFNIQGPDLYVVTEFMERGSLFDVLAQPELLTPCTKAHMLQDAVQGVAFLHQCKPPIVHHDLKSLNLLVSQNYTVKITDFGVTVANMSHKRRSRFEEDACQTGLPPDATTALFVTPGPSGCTIQWMAPELCLQDAICTTASDIFAIGVIFWEVASCRRPWLRVPHPQILNAILRGERLPLNPAWPTPFRDFIKMLWHQNPKKRPSAKAILKRLQVVAIPSSP